MYKAILKGTTRVGRQVFELEIATQEQLKMVWDAEELSGCGHQAVEKVEAKSSKEK